MGPEAWFWLVVKAAIVAWFLDKVVFRLLGDIYVALTIRSLGIEVEILDNETVRITVKLIDEKLKDKQEKYINILLEDIQRSSRIKNVELKTYVKKGE